MVGDGKPLAQHLADRATATCREGNAKPGIDQPPNVRQEFGGRRLQTPVGRHDGAVVVEHNATECLRFYPRNKSCASGG